MRQVGASDGTTPVRPVPSAIVPSSGAPPAAVSPVPSPSAPVADSLTASQAGSAPVRLALTEAAPDWTASLPPAAQQAFQALSDTEQSRLAGLRSHVDAAGQQCLIALLSHGTLTETAANGDRLLDVLDRLTTVPLALPAGADPEAYRQEQLSALLSHIDDPGTISQGVVNTCGPTVVQIAMAANRPADYARFALGLLTSGTGIMPTGEPVPRLADSLPRPEFDRRPAVSRLIQAALLAWSSPLSYSAKSDRNGIALPLVGRIDLAPGASGTMEAQMWQAATGQDLRVWASRDLIKVVDGGGPLSGKGKDDLLQALDVELSHQIRDRVRRPLVPLELAWGSSSHWVGVTSATPDRLYFRNPNGNLFDAYATGVNGKPRSRHVDPVNGLEYVEATASFGKGPRLRIYADGTQSMARQDLADRLYTVVVSRETAAAVD